MASATKSAATDTKPLHDVIAGALARAGSQACIHPLDTLKVRLQAGKQSLYNAEVPTTRAGIALPRSVSFAIGLYKGCAEAAIGAGVIIGSYFAFYSTSKMLLQQHTELPQGSVAFVSGGVAAVGSSVVKVPIAVCIRSVQAGNYKNAVQAAQGIYRKAGFFGMYSGMVPTLLEDIPDSAVKFAMYESLRQGHRALTGRPANAVEDLAMGGIAGAVAAAASTPLDVIKTRMQVNAAVRPTMVQAAQSVWRDAGARGFFFGVGPRVLSNGINSAVFFSFFEAIRTFIISRKGGNDGNSRAASSSMASSSSAAQGARPAQARASPSASSSSSKLHSSDSSSGVTPRTASLTVALSSRSLGEFNLPLDLGTVALPPLASQLVLGDAPGKLVQAGQQLHTAIACSRAAAWRPTI